MGKQRKQKAEGDVIEGGLAFGQKVSTMVRACSGRTLAPALRRRGNDRG